MQVYPVVKLSVKVLYGLIIGDLCIQRWTYAGISVYE